MICPAFVKISESHFIVKHDDVVLYQDFAILGKQLVTVIFQFSIAAMLKLSILKPPNAHTFSSEQHIMNY